MTDFLYGLFLGSSFVLSLVLAIYSLEYTAREVRILNFYKVEVVQELHNGVKPRLRTRYVNRRNAYKKVEEWNNREKEKVHSYYIKEFEVIE